MPTGLSERGHQTKLGRPFHQHAVLTIVRNRSYLGETSFRGNGYPAPYEPLVEEALFERAQEILRERGGDPSLRRSNQSDYLLTGLVRCGKRLIGAAAHGNGGRYSYYVCFTRQRYGKRRCDADRLTGRAPRRGDPRPAHLRARSGVARPRSDRGDLRRAEPLSDEDLRALQAHVREAIETGDPPARKALLQALVHEIRVVSREDPTLRLSRGPTSVRVQWS